MYINHWCPLITPLPLSCRSGVSLLKYFESPDDTDAGWNSGAGITILKAIHILANGTEALVTSMTSCNLASMLVRCLHLFISLPSPGVCVCRGRCVCGWVGVCMWL